MGYTVEKYLADVVERYGGADSILLWPTCARCPPPPSSHQLALPKRAQPQPPPGAGNIYAFNYLSIVHRYPNIGVDNRNQIDLFRAMPGGYPALRNVLQKRLA